MDNEKTIKKNLLHLINNLKKQGTVGASYENLKQLVSTKGLTCTVKQYDKLWNKVVRNIKVKGFDIYEGK